MKLIVSKPIKGFINMGKENEKSFFHVSPGQKLEVIFDNTQVNNGKITGHYICVHPGTSSVDMLEEGLLIVVFPSQVLYVIEERTRESRRGNRLHYYIDSDNTKEEDDPFSTLVSGDDESLLEGYNS